MLLGSIMAQLHEMSRFGSSRGRCAGACRRGRGAGSGRVSRRFEVVGGLDFSNGSSLVGFFLFGGKKGEPNDKEDDTSNDDDGEKDDEDEERLVGEPKVAELDAKRGAFRWSGYRNVNHCL